MEDAAGLGPGAALQLRFDVPGEVGFAVVAEDGVGAEGVEVFRVDEEAIHVEEAGADWWEALGRGLLACERMVCWWGELGGFTIFVRAPW